MNNDETPSQAPGQVVDDPTGIAAPGSPEGSPEGPALEEISTNPPPVPGLQVEKLAGSLWHRPDCPDDMPRTHLPKWENLHAGPLVDMPVELVAALTTLAREIGPGAFRVTFSFEAR
jgi:hypothetical protein